MATLADARTDEIANLLATLGPFPEHVELRPVETGLVMLQGRIGGDGAPFNFGEATVTRAAIRIASGEIGFAYVLGRDRDKARLAALCDALWQNEATRERMEREVLTPIRQRLADERTRRREQTAASRVDFFTLVRGED
jgi:alpha-D-ribose 1-methylphosphonate 5-triphosphate synthase subunit PhnG